MTGLAGKHAVVSGGGTGVGLAIARALAGAGADVTVLGRRVEVLRATGLSFQPCDVTDAAATRAAIDKAQAAHGPVAIAVANAGAAQSQPFLKMTPDDLRAMVDVNLMGTFTLWQAVLPDMIGAGWGRLISVASMAGLKGYPYVAGYCAAKHGVVGLVRALSLELARKGVTVNALCPGFVETPLLERALDNITRKTGMTRDAADQTLRAGNPQNRFIQTDEPAGAALWLCGDAARSVNGQTLAISGGET